MWSLRKSGTLPGLNERIVGDSIRTFIQLSTLVFVNHGVQKLLSSSWCIWSVGFGPAVNQNIVRSDIWFGSLVSSFIVHLHPIQDFLSTVNITLLSICSHHRAIGDSIWSFIQLSTLVFVNHGVQKLLSSSWCIWSVGFGPAVNQNIVGSDVWFGSLVSSIIVHLHPVQDFLSTDNITLFGICRHHRVVGDSIRTSIQVSTLVFVNHCVQKLLSSS
mmetsp:Transcript_2454/g.4615  ORF Transcript_2454/g.4615 Transcript_2454/m.4615 type:complete len:216 (+) Transcript_2454:158-805(+)